MKVYRMEETFTKTLFLNIKNEEKKEKIQELCTSLNLETKKLSASDLNKTILRITKGSIPGMPDTLPVNIPVMYELPELVIFSGFEETDVKAFLSEYKNRGIEKVPLKCMVTPFNLSWTLYDLIEHLKEEHRGI